MCILCDILMTMKCFQQSFESDCASMFDIAPKKNDFFQRMEHIKNASVEKGWEEMFLENIDDSDDVISFFGNNLRYTNSTFTYGSPRRQTIISSLMELIRERLAADVILDEILQPLNEIKSTATSESLMRCHSFIAIDLDPQDFRVQYYESAELLKHFPRKNVHESLQKLVEVSNELNVFKTALARAVVAKPHSADVERLISIHFRCKFNASLRHK